MKTRKSKRIFFLVIGFMIVITIGILAWYQVFYKSPLVNHEHITLENTFKRHQGIVTAVRFSLDDSLMITGSVDSTVKIWNRETGNIIRQIKQAEGISYLDLSSDGKYIVTGSYDSKVRIWSTEEGKLIREFSGASGTIWTVAFSHDGKKIAASGDDAVIRIWDIQSGALLQQLKGHKRIVWSVKFSPDDTKLASGSFDYSFKLWNTSDGNLLWDNREHDETVVDLAFSHDGALLGSTSDDKTMRLWNVSTHKMVGSMKVAEHVQAIAFSPDDRYVLTGGRDKPLIGEFLQNIFGDSQYNKGISARIWKVQTGELVQTLNHHANDVMDVAWSHCGKWIATASADGTVDVWDQDLRRLKE